VSYPEVVGEFDTVAEILEGKSIARFGDGEVKILEGKAYVRENADLALTEEIQQVMFKSHPDCLIGIPTMDPNGPKFPNWSRHQARFLKYLDQVPDTRFYSAFITRPDSAPWIECQEFVDLLTRIWLGKRVSIVSEPQSKLLVYVKKTSQSVRHIECPSHGAYSRIDHFERDITKYRPDVALLSCGPTATCLAQRLAKRGIQAVDLGSVGGFLLRWLRGDPKPESYAAERVNK
jgi:hypothetical protein